MKMLLQTTYLIIISSKFIIIISQHDILFSPNLPGKWKRICLHHHSSSSPHKKKRHSTTTLLFSSKSFFHWITIHTIHSSSVIISRDHPTKIERVIIIKEVFFETLHYQSEQSQFKYTISCINLRLP